jgi:hypothetical protein
MYALQRLQRLMIWSCTTGTGSSESCSDAYGEMTRAKGSFDFLSSEWLVGIVFSVHRRYLLDSFANSEAVTAAFDGRLIGGGGL